MDRPSTGQPGTPPAATASELQSGPVEASDREAVSRIAFLSVLAGLCPIIPIPFLDDLVLQLVRKKAIRSEFKRFALTPSPAQLEGMTRQSSDHLLGCIATLIIYPIKKIFKKVFFVLAIKDCVDAASAAFHELWLVRYALEHKMISSADITVEADALMPLRQAIETTCKQVDTRPINQVLRRGFSTSKGMLKEAASTLASTIRQSGGTRKNPDGVERAVAGVNPGEGGRVNELADAIGERVWAERGYLTALEKKFEQTFTAPSAEHSGQPKP